MIFIHNPYTLKAVELVRSGRSLFITGKAGTGKTYLLEYIVEICKQYGKNVSVVAPTGVAARNAGGKTIHSFLKLKPSVYIPGVKIRGYKYSLDNREDELDTVRKLDILIIDEISMVRCDLLDCIDDQLRHYRRNDSPFGGLQVLLFGDFYQLPPVLDEDKTEADMIKEYYQSEFAFHSDVWRKVGFPMLELDVNQRQKGDERFFEILNRIRIHDETPVDLIRVNRKVEKGRLMSSKDNVIKLCAFNKTADGTNFALMQELRSVEVEKKARVRYYKYGVQTFIEEDEWDDYRIPKDDYPTEKYLKLKVGAKVMFLRNEPGVYDNGTIGFVKRIYEDEIVVQTEKGNTVHVERASWPFYHDYWDKKNKVYEQYLYATFEQFPLRLAWAITIHKSQGLTFSDVIIDIRNAFAHGQTYVALSRCKTLDGVRLNSAITSSEIIIDQNVVNFMNNAERIIVDVTNGSAVEIKITADIFRKTKMYDVMGYKTRDWMIGQINAGLSYDDALEKLHTDKRAAWDNTMSQFKRRYPNASIYETKDGKIILSNKSYKVNEPSTALYKLSNDGKEIIKGIKSLSGVITIPFGIERIGENAFEDCEGITSVVFPPSLKHIGNTAFNGCTSLSSIVLPDSLKTIEYDAFLYTSLKQVYIPQNVSFINSQAFPCPMEVSPLNNTYTSKDGILYSKDMKCIECYPRNKHLKEFTIPESVTEIAPWAFECAHIDFLYASKSLKKICNNAFDEIQSLSIYVYDGIGEIESSILANSKEDLTLYLLSSNIASIKVANDAFENMNKAHIHAVLSQRHFINRNPKFRSQFYGVVCKDGTEPTIYNVNDAKEHMQISYTDGVALGTTKVNEIIYKGFRCEKRDASKISLYRLKERKFFNPNNKTILTHMEITGEVGIPVSWNNIGLYFDLSFWEWRQSLETLGFVVEVKQKPQETHYSYEGYRFKGSLLAKTQKNDFFILLDFDKTNFSEYIGEYTTDTLSVLTCYVK